MPLAAAAAPLWRGGGVTVWGVASGRDGEFTLNEAAIDTEAVQ